MPARARTRIRGGEAISRNPNQEQLAEWNHENQSYWQNAASGQFDVLDRSWLRWRPDHGRIGPAPDWNELPVHYFLGYGEECRLGHLRRDSCAMLLYLSVFDGKHLDGVPTYIIVTVLLVTHLYREVEHLKRSRKRFTISLGLFVFNNVRIALLLAALGVAGMYAFPKIVAIP